MSSRVNVLAEELIESVLAKLNLSQRPAPTLESLKTLYSAWCRRVPFDNIRKLIHLRNGNPGPLPGDDAAEFFDHWLRFGSGGTCWAGNGALQTLLHALGFDARRAVATMLVTPDSPPNHGSVTVDFGRQRYVVDASILHGEPLLLDEGLPAADLPAWAVKLAFRGGHWAIRWRPLHIPEGIDCRIEAFDAGAVVFRERHEKSRSFSPFNHELRVRLNRGDSVIGAALGQRLEFAAQGVASQRPLQGQERLRFLIEEIGIHEALARALPADLPTSG